MKKLSKSLLLSGTFCVVLKRKPGYTRPIFHLLKSHFEDRRWIRVKLPARFEKEVTTTPELAFGRRQPWQLKLP